MLTVTISAPSGYQGFILQARSINNPLDIIGTWITPTNSLQARHLACQNTADTVTHPNINTKTTQTFTWVAPNTDIGFIGDIVFR